MAVACNVNKSPVRLIRVLSREQLVRAADRISPVRCGGTLGDPNLPVENRNYVFPRDLREASFSDVQHFVWGESADGLWFLADINVCFRYNAPTSFVPTVAEVLEQIPRRYWREAVAFELGPMAGGDKADVAWNNGYHMAVVRLYCRR